MEKWDSKKVCPCGTGKAFGDCCSPLLKRKKKAQTAEDMMRSRYSAFVVGDVDYIMDTHHPEKREGLDRDSLQEWSHHSVWQGLKVGKTEKGGAADEEGVVEFTATYTNNSEKSETIHHQETALFKRHKGDWYFFDVCKNLPIRNENKTQRNDPCPCGSGKKYKKCHGK